uniref:Uncharacterized protein n=1 Tax=Arundo donax TaxID=35708 RepID=A0A0A9GT74_ARUDO
MNEDEYNYQAFWGPKPRLLCTPGMNSSPATTS